MGSEFDTVWLAKLTCLGRLGRDWVEAWEVEDLRAAEMQDEHFPQEQRAILKVVWW